MRTLTLGRVYDIVPIKEGNHTLKLTVCDDPMRMVAGLNQAQLRLKTINNETPDEEAKDVALFFAGVIFGQEQAEKLLELYRGDAASVIQICGLYFSKRLAKLITRAQKKAK